MSAEPIDYGQRIRAALNREKTARDAAWMNVNVKIAGVECVQMTVRHYLMLDAVDSPFVRGGSPTPEQLAQLLWIVSPSFSERDGEAFKFAKEIAKLPFLQTVSDAMEYMETTFLDAPQGSKSDESVSYYSWVASIIDALASEYGWSPAEILDLPLRQVFQLLRAMKKRNDPKCGMINTLSDRAKLDYLASLKKAA